MADVMLTYVHLCVMIIGFCVGSFLNVCIWRLPEYRSVIKPRSHCEVCHTPVAAKDNIPIVSWLILGGKCRHCGAAISPVHVTVELLTGVVAWLLFRKIVPTWADLDTLHLLAWTVFFTFVCMLIIGAFTDVRDHIIPLETSVYPIPLAVGAVSLLYGFGYDDWLAISWKESVLGAFLPTALIILVVLAHWLMRGVGGMGEGDIRLVALIGAFVGPAATVFILMLAMIPASFVGIVTLMITHKRTAPLGPYLAAASTFYLLYGEHYQVNWAFTRLL